MKRNRLKNILRGISAAVLAACASLVFFFALPQHGSSTVSAANSTYSMTGGRVLYNMNSGTDSAKYNALSSTGFDNYTQRCKFKIASSGTVNRANEQTLYTDSGSFTISFNFYHVNDGIDKSWIKTDAHYLYLCKFGDSEFNITSETSVSAALNRAQSTAVSPASQSGESIKDSACSLSRTYSNLPAGRYTIWARFHQGHGIASSQFNNYFAYAQDIVVDYTAPNITVDATNNAAQSSIKASWSSVNKEAPISATYVKNGVYQGSYSSGQTLTAEGKYVVNASDYAGNSASVTMYVDRTAPSLHAVNGQSSAYVEIDKNLSYASPVTATYTYNGVAQGAYTSGQTLTRTGKYVINAVDRAGNSASTTVYVDNSAPILSASPPSKSSVKATWSVGAFESPVSASYTYNGLAQGAYTSGQTLTNEGKYVVTATDGCGNTATATMYVDKTAPALTRDAEYAKNANAIRWPAPGANESAIAGATYTRTYYDDFTQSIVTSSPADYSSGLMMTAEGKYTVTVEDAASNSTSIVFTVDRTAPQVTASDPSRNAVSASWRVASYESPVSATYTLNGSAARAYTSGQTLTAEGKYIVSIADAAGNSVSVTMHVDRTAPVLTGSDPSKSSVAASWRVSEYETAVTATYTITTSAGTSAPAAYTSGQVLTAEGKYTITAADAVNNSTTIVLYVDRTAPALTGSNPSKSSVKAAWSVSAYETAVSATYTYNGVDQGVYTSGQTLTAEGKYVVTATDAVGNSASVTLYVDRTAPALARDAEYAKNGCSAVWTIGAFDSAVTATYTVTTAAGTSAPAAYTSGQVLTAEGKYTVSAIDAAGNSASVVFTIDRTSPALKLSAQITRDSASVSWIVAGYESPVTVTYFRNGSRLGAYASGQAISVEGEFRFEAIDAAGNVTTATILVDKTAPTLAFTAAGQTFTGYTRDPFIAAGADNLSGVDVLEIYVGGKWCAYDYTPRDKNGSYLFRITDHAGNITNATVVVFRADTFGNLASIRDGYKINAWYVVTLPARVFTTPGKDIAGRYSFESYDAALQFAIECEREFRVTPVQGGWMYVSPTNESVSQKYTDESTLAAAVRKYATGYVSARQTASESGNDKYYTEPESMTRNAPILPNFLLDYNTLPRYFVRSAYEFRLPAISYLADMPYRVTAKYLGDLAYEDGDVYSIAPGMPFKTAIGDRYKQGWYIISESDAAGNAETYIVYSDAELPTARVSATYGYGDKDLIIDFSFVKNEALYFISFRFEALLDNADAFVSLKIERGNSVYYFTQGDDLPTLGAGGDFGAGKYTVTIFDRSLNALMFDVFIAGAEPAWSHGSLAADRVDCTVTFVPGDRYNVFTSISIFKIEYDGTRTQLSADGYGTAITPATLSYKLTIGGKYCATISDNYGRTLDLPSIFFLKGLPEGKISGVTDGGRTNKNVSFTFSSGDVAVVYVLKPGGVREVFNGYTVQTGASETTYNITASEETSHEYLVFLHNASDMSLYLEYTFEIDTILPEFIIMNSDGERIDPDGATNKSFSLTWQETGVTVRYYTAKGGSLNAQRYNMGAVLSAGTLYYFTMKDDVGNVLEFTILLDNSVDYSIDGKYNQIDGVLYANKPITFTVNEPTQAFDVVNADGHTFVNGGSITQAGRYEITVTDNYRNTLRLVIVLDFSAPTIDLHGVANGGATKDDVVITAFDYDYLYAVDAKGSVIKAIVSGEIFSLGGKFFVRAEDYAGNTVTVTFTIDTGVEFTMSVPDGAVTTGGVTIMPGEPLDVTATRDREPIAGHTFTEPGVYVVLLTDDLGNSIELKFVILPARMKTLDISLPAGTRAIRAIRDGEQVDLAGGEDKIVLDTSGKYVVTIDCGGVQYDLQIEVDNDPPHLEIKQDGNTVKLAGIDKQYYTISLMKDGKSIDCRIGSTLKDPGKYVLTVVDDLGNTQVYEFVIRYRLNTWAIVAIAAGAAVAIAAIILIIRARRKPRVI